MRNLSMPILILASFAAPAMAAEAKIDITFPESGSMLKAGVQSKFGYEITLGGDADHAHLYVDGKETALLRQMMGNITLDPMARGMHEICAKLVNKNHTPISVERCIKVTAE